MSMTQKQLMTHVVVGYPDIRQTEQIVKALIAGGSDYVELQIPFSDPMADGPTIMGAGDVALKHALNGDDYFDFAKHLSEHITSKYIFVVYANTIIQYGISKFCMKAKQSGIHGIIIPDLPYDTPEGLELLTTCNRIGLCYIPVISMGLPKKRIESLIDCASDFMYVTSYLGVTGSDTNFDAVLAFITHLRSRTNKRLALGFGIKTPDDVLQVRKKVDIVVVGSAIVNVIRSCLDDTNAMHLKLTKYVRSLKQELFLKDSPLD